MSLRASFSTTFPLVSNIAPTGWSDHATLVTAAA